MQEREFSGCHMHRGNTDMPRLTITTSRVMLILDLLLEKVLHPGAGFHQTVVSSSRSDKQTVLLLQKSTRTASSSTLGVFLNSRSSLSGGKFARTSTTWSLDPKLAATAFSSSI